MGVLAKIKDTMSLVSKRTTTASLRKVGSLEYEMLKKILVEKKDAFIRIETRVMFYSQLQKEMEIEKAKKEDLDMITEDLNLLESVKTTLEAEIEKMTKKMALLKKMGYAKKEESRDE